MKITRLETIPLRVPVKPEFAIRSGRGGSHAVSPFLLVKVHTDEGFIGLGEASCTPRWSGEDQVTGAHLLHTYLEPLLVGENPLEVEKLVQKFRLAFAFNPFTKAAVEMAIWDLAGQAAGKPLYELLGGKVREFIPTKWSVSGIAPEKAADIARWAISQGFKAMKVKVGLEPEGDVARVSAVREAIGPQVKLGVDANGGWTPESALATMERLYEHHVAFAEQPLPPEDNTRLPELRRQLRVPVVADESVWSLQDAKALAALGAADVLSIYVGKAGGILPALRIAQFAETAGLKCTIGSNLELGIGSAAMIHLGLAARGIAAEEFPCDIIGPFYYEADILAEPLPLRPGEARASNAPGLGVKLNEKVVKELRLD